MNRRQYLTALGVDAVGLAGCSSIESGAGNGTAASDGTAGDSGTTRSGGQPDAASMTDVELPIPRDDLNRGAPRDAIPAITDPVFAADWRDVGERAEAFEPTLSADLSLSADDVVIGVQRDGQARAYPLRILNWHEVVNDELGGPLLVTYCPLCGSGVTAERRVAGEVTQFGVSGLLYRSDLVMYDDATGSLWSQIMATAIRGERTGDTLTLLPSSFTTWADWQSQYPDTEVLLPPPISNTVTGRTSRTYSINPYDGYDETDRIGVGINEFDDDRLHPKATVVGIATDGEARAYPLDAVSGAGVVEGTVGGTPVVVTSRNESLFAYERTVDGETLSFEQADDAHLRAGGSRWEIVTGQAVDGPFEGQSLAQANDRSPMFWFAWADFHPDTSVYGQ